MGLGDDGVAVWNIAQVAGDARVVVVMVAVLYYATPNVKQPKFRWISVGAVVAILVWVLASLGVRLLRRRTSSNYNKTYGSLAGVIVFLLWLWITNLALLFGAEIDAELERGASCRPASRPRSTIQLPPRDTPDSDKAEDKLDRRSPRAVSCASTPRTRGDAADGRRAGPARALRDGSGTSRAPGRLRAPTSADRARGARPPVGHALVRAPETPASRRTPRC